MTKAEMFEKARKGDVSILSDPRVAKIRDDCGDTPLHLLAKKGKIAILSHPMVSKVTNQGNLGWTPLHLLALEGKKSILKHSDVRKFKDDCGDTPFVLLKRRLELKEAFAIWLEGRPSGGSRDIARTEGSEVGWQKRQRSPRRLRLISRKDDDHGHTR